MSCLHVVHVLHSLGLGGAARATISAAKYSARQGPFRHSLVSLIPGQPATLDRAAAAGLTVYEAPDAPALDRILSEADIVQLNFWNSPELYSFLRRPLPAMRMLTWIQIAGDTSPQVVTPELVEFSDFILSDCTHTANLAVVRQEGCRESRRPTAIAWPGADFARLLNTRPQAHAGFNVGYIGTVDFSKLHPAFVAMSTRVNVADAHFVVCGSGAGVATLQRQAAASAMADRFEWIPYLEDIGSLLQTLDVFGYPLCAGTYASSEVVLQEAMFAAVPPVLFRRTATLDVVEHGKTALIVDSEQEYVEAIEYLARCADVRRQMGENGRAAMQESFGAENTARQLHGVYLHLAGEPKRVRRWPATRVGESVDRDAALFVQSLGDHGLAFRTSLASSDIHELLEAESIIRQSLPVLTNAGGGGILHYRSCFRDDRYLHLWSGLVLLQQGRPALALAEFAQARHLGFDHWRLDWYLAQAAEQADAHDLARQAVAKVIGQAPIASAAANMANRLRAAAETTRDEGRGTRDKGRGTRDEGRGSRVLTLRERKNQ